MQRHRGQPRDDQLEDAASRLPPDRAAQEATLEPMVLNPVNAHSFVGDSPQEKWKDAQSNVFCTLAVLRRACREFRTQISHFVEISNFGLIVTRGAAHQPFCRLATVQQRIVFCPWLRCGVPLSPPFLFFRGNMSGNTRACTCKHTHTLACWLPRLYLIGQGVGIAISRETLHVAWSCASFFLLERCAKT